MRVCLINPLGPKGTVRSMPHGLMQIQAEMIRAGHEVDIWDYNIGMGITFDEDRLFDYDLVGLSVLSTQLSRARKIADRINGRVPVVWGGVHATLDPASILSEYPEHFVVAGEGEHPMLWLADYLEGKVGEEWLREQRGICYVDSSGVYVVNKAYFIKDINQLADVDYEKLPHFELYLDQYEAFFDRTVQRLPVLVSRGCHWNCSFCINSLFRKSGGRYRAKSMEKIKRECEAVIDKYSIDFVEPRAEDLCLDGTLLGEWRQFSREKKFLWCANGRFNYFKTDILNKESLTDMTENGFYNLNMAVEAGDEYARNELLNKKVKDSDIIAAVDVVRTVKGDHLGIGTSFVTHFPGDYPENRIKIIKLMDYLSSNINILFSGPQVYRPYPGSPLFNLQEKKVVGDFSYYTKNFDDEGAAMEAAHPWEGHFFSHIVPRYYNDRFKPLTYEKKPDGHFAIMVDSRARRSKHYLISLLMIPINIRLKNDCWKFFVDPYVLGGLHRMLITVFLVGRWPRVKSALASIPFLRKIKRAVFG